MPEEKMIPVVWYNCDCPFTTKYCDEFHTERALVPASVLKSYQNKR